MNKWIIIGLVSAILIGVLFFSGMLRSAPTIPWGDEDNISGTAILGIYLVTADGEEISVFDDAPPLAVFYQGYQVIGIRIRVLAEAHDNTGGQYPKAKVESMGGPPPHIRVDFTISDDDGTVGDDTGFGYFQSSFIDVCDDGVPTPFPEYVQFGFENLVALGFTDECNVHVQVSGDFYYWGLDDLENIEFGPETYWIETNLVSDHAIFVSPESDAITFDWSHTWEWPI